MPAKNYTNSDLYDRLDSLRLEVKQDISTAVNTVAMSQGRLEKKFDDLEAGRLTRAEGNINDLRLEVERATNKLGQNQAVMSTKIIVIWAIGSALISIITTAVITSVVGGLIK